MRIVTGVDRKAGGRVSAQFQNTVLRIPGRRRVAGCARCLETAFGEASRVGLMLQGLIRGPTRRLWSQNVASKILSGRALTTDLRPAHICLVYVLLEEVSELVLVLGQTELAANRALVRELDLRGRIEVCERVLPCQNEGRAIVLQQDAAGN